eukprot:45205_1
MNEYDSFCCGGTAMLMHARRAIGTRKHAHARTYINYTNSCTAKCLYCCGTPYCCDEKAYSNPCAARCNGHKFINFKCKADICEGDERCNYPQKHEPVCCNNGTEKEEEYGNYCEAMCHEDASVCEVGKCTVDTGCICSVIWDPYCCGGSNKSYANLCAAECDGFHESQRKRGATCGRGATYYGAPPINPCLAQQAGSMSHYVAMVKSLVMNA